jgi:hypothetical protein
VSMVFTGRGRCGGGLTSPPPGGDFPLAPRESMRFFVLLSWSSGVSFLPTSRVVEILFSLTKSGGG